MITTYDELVVEIGAYTHRTDLVPRIGTFVQQTESRLDRQLEVAELEVIVRINPEVSLVPFNANYKRLIQVQVADRDVEYMSPAQIAQRYRPDQGGPSRNYTIEGRQLRLVPFSAGESLRYVYEKRVTPLSENNQANELLATYPELYLWGSLVEAFRFMQDYEAGQASMDIFNQHVDDANLASERGMQGDGLMMRAS